MAPQSFLKTSNNVIVEALRREGEHIEVRLVECMGSAGTANVTLKLPHKQAVLTDLTEPTRPRVLLFPRRPTSRASCCTPAASRSLPIRCRR